MAYTVNKTNGSVLATVSDGTIDTSTDLVLIGKNYAGYGEFLNENYVKLLENFANTTAPSSPLAGQMWWDTTNSLLKVYTGSAFKTVSSSTSSPTTPSGSVTGDLWWDTTNGQLKVYNGSSFTTIGPAFTSASGTSGAIVEVVTDNAAADHVVVKLYVSNVVVGTISKDAEFTPQAALGGFATIKPGIQLSTTVSGAKLQGTATDSDSLGGVLAANYLRSNVNDSTSGVLSVLNDTGLVVGADSDLTITINGSSNPVFTNTNTNGSVVLAPNGTGTVDVSSKKITSLATPTAGTDAANKSYVDGIISFEIADYLPLAGGTMTGALNMGTNNITNGGTITATAFSGPLTGNVTGNLSGTATVATTATNVSVADESTDTTCYVTFVTGATGGLPMKSGTNLTFNSATGALTATSFVGSLTGNVTGTATEATNVTLTANDTTNETVYLTFADGATGTQGLETDTGLSYNPSTNTLTTAVFAGTASSAEYADVAERFQADAIYEAGTVVALGGVEEITRVNEELSDQVFGVISHKPAYMMNAGLRGETSAPVAVAGRVPVRVVGLINKGERLVSAGNGLARAAQPGEATSFNVIGRAIETKTTEGEGTVEAFVTIN